MSCNVNPNAGPSLFAVFPVEVGPERTLFRAYRRTHTSGTTAPPATRGFQASRFDPIPAGNNTLCVTNRRTPGTIYRMVTINSCPMARPFWKA